MLAIDDESKWLISTRTKTTVGDNTASNNQYPNTTNKPMNRTGTADRYENNEYRSDATDLLYNYDQCAELT